MIKYALIVAAGSGTRMESDVPKQFLPIKGKPLLFYSLQSFYQYDPQVRIIVVLAMTELPRWEKLCEEYNITIPHKKVIGGATRTQSVKNGLNAIHEDGLVAIHDGARPLASKEVIDRCYQSAEVNGSGVACIQLKDSIRQLKGEHNKALNREELRLVQTPQTFQISLIKHAFELFKEGSSSDDATILEKAGHEVHLVEGSYYNIKVTTPEDLALANMLLHH